jgi:hypothetical protein
MLGDQVIHPQPKRVDFNKLITRSYTITTRYRYLWWLGLLAGIGSGANFNPPDSEQMGGKFKQIGDQAGQWAQAHLPLVIAAAVLLFLLLIALCVIALMARGGLIGAVQRIEREEPATFRIGMGIGYHAFWRLLGAGLLVGLGAIVLIAILAAPIVALFIAEIWWAGVVLILVFLPILIFALILANVLTEYASRFIVCEGQRIVNALGSAYALIRATKGQSALVWLMFVALSIGVGIALLIVVVLVGGPLFLLGMAIYGAAGLAMTIVYAAVFGLAFLFAVLLVAGITTVFLSSYWTLAYLQLTAPPPSPAVPIAPDAPIEPIGPIDQPTPA